MAIASISQPMDQEEDAIAAVADVYILSGAIYTRADGSWAPLTLLVVHLEKPGPARSIGRADE